MFTSEEEQTHRHDRGTASASTRTRTRRFFVKSRAAAGKFLAFAPAVSELSRQWRKRWWENPLRIGARCPPSAHPSRRCHGRSSTVTLHLAHALSYRPSAIGHQPPQPPPTLSADHHSGRVEGYVTGLLHLIEGSAFAGIYWAFSHSLWLCRAVAGVADLDFFLGEGCVSGSSSVVAALRMCRPSLL
jgi:hypothetical protein